MPTYDFACTCGFRATYVLATDKRDMPPPCPECGDKLKRQYTAPAITFNGDGFYSTDRNN